MNEALLGFAAVFVLALLRVPLAFAMGFVGYVGLGLMRGWGPTAAAAAQVVYDSGFAYTLSVVPLFILMGNFVARAGLAQVQRNGRVDRVRRGVLAALAPADIAARAVFFEDRPQVPLGPDMAPFETGADLLGDGALLAVQLPGHCPGHWGLLVRQSDDRTRFLIADAAWSSGAVRDDAPPPRLTTALLGATGPYRGTLNALHQLWARTPELLITPSHCGEVEVEVETGRAD